MSFIYNMADTWNAGGTVFTAIKMNVTNTASDPTSLIMDLQVGGISQHSVGPTGIVMGVDSGWTIGQTTTPFGRPSAIYLGLGSIYNNGGVYTFQYGLPGGGGASVGMFGSTDIQLTTGGTQRWNINNAGWLEALSLYTIKTGSGTVASLPTAASAGSGARLFVTNSSTIVFTATVTGSGGAVATPVYSDGTQWRVG